MREECGGLSHQIKMCMEEKRITENNLAEARLEIERLKDFQHTLKAEVDLKDQKIGDLLERIKEHDAAHNLIEEEKSMFNAERDEHKKNLKELQDELMVERKKSDSFSSKWMAEKEISHSLSLKIAELQRDQYSHQAEIQTLKQSLVEVKNQARGDNSSFREDIEQKLEQQREISTRLHSEIQSLRKEKEELKTMNERFRRQISHVTEEYSQNASRVDELESKNTDLKTQLRTLDDQLKRISSEKSNLQELVSSLKKSNMNFSTHNEQLQQRVKQMNEELRIKQNESSFLMHSSNVYGQQQAQSVQSSYGYNVQHGRGSQPLPQTVAPPGYQNMSSTMDGASPSLHPFAQAPSIRGRPPVSQSQAPDMRFHIGKSFDHVYHLRSNADGGGPFPPINYRYGLSPIVQTAGPPSRPPAGQFVQQAYVAAEAHPSFKPLHEFTPDDIAAVGYDPRSVIGC
mmetsp:Transcript_20365/g.68040  ORF Transcript_20365/g.68040 Transcript_20365/m.68040 type:complete len:457 (-) Transcript_20365:102-1472(-)